MRRNSTKFPEMKDKEIALLARVSLGLRGRYKQSRLRQWRGSPFAWILSYSSRQRGKIGEQLISGWCAERGLIVVPSPDSEADRIIEGARIEIKLSTLWQNGSYRLQQIRDQDYRFLLCIGISPFHAHGWIIEKNAIPFDELRHQHGGARGRDTWWIEVKPDSPPAWMDKKGDFTEVYKTLININKR